MIDIGLRLIVAISVQVWQPNELEKTVSGISSASVYGTYFLIRAETASLRFTDDTQERNYHNEWKARTQVILDSVKRILDPIVKSTAKRNHLRLHVYKREFDEYTEAHHERYNELHVYDFAIPLKINPGNVSMRVVFMCKKKAHKKNNPDKFRDDIIRFFGSPTEGE